MNRLAARIAEIRVKCEALEPKQAEELERTLAITPEEAFRFQQLQAEAHVMGVLTTEEAQVVYVAIGESAAGWKKDVDLATKVVVTLTMEQLLKRKIAGRNT